ncbi:MAG TPA: zinc ribbon domain-containing protein [Spirochaetota bacterium]|nr:zinc ribbon domain-containing protein [Spirochaetota bacterium]
MINENWFGKLLLDKQESRKDKFGLNPEEMIKNASNKAFAISSAAALVPGPAGFATILPELLAITKIQINLIADIADYYGMTPNVNSSTIILVFASELGLSVRGLAKKTGGKVIINVLSQKAVLAVSKRIGIKIGGKVTQRVLGRIVPFILAPIFGKFSKTMTERIGKEAIDLFSNGIEIENSDYCVNGHPVSGNAKFCPECGVRIDGWIRPGEQKSLKNTEYYYLEE